MGADALIGVLGAAEWYLLAAALLVAALGLYELFVGKLEAVPPLLRVRGLNKFARRIAGLLPLMTVVEVLRRAPWPRHDGGLHLLCLAIGVLIVGAILYIGAGRLSRE